MKLYLVLSIAIALTVGCASTNITGYTDPAYSSKSYQSTVIFASNVGLEQASMLEGAICEKFQANGVKCSPFQLLFPPTRQYSAESVFEGLKQKGLQSIVILSAGGDNSSSQVFGYQNYGSATAYGNTAQTQSSSYALRSYSRQSDMRIVLIDASSGDTAWIGDAKTKGQGLINTTDSAFNSSVVGKVVNTLLESPHFASQ